MGMMLTCTPLPCTILENSSSSSSSSDPSHTPSSHSQDHIHSDPSSSSSCLYSEPSLPSVPTLSSHHHPPAAHHRCLATLKGHSSYVFSLSLAGKFLFSGSSDKEIRAWPRNPSLDHHSNHKEDNNIVAVGHGAVKALTVLGDKLFSAHQDHKIRVWKIDIADGGGGGDFDLDSAFGKFKCIATLPTVSDRMWRLLSAENYVEVRRHKKCTWVHHVDAVSALAVARDGSDLLYSVSWDRSFKVWRVGSDFRCLESVPNAHDDAINAVALSKDEHVYTGSADKKIKVWKKKKGEKKHTLVATLEKHKSAVNALAISEDGSILYSGACDRSIVVWERIVGGDGDGDGGDGHMVVVGALRGHTKAILCLAVVGDLLLSGSADKTVRVWRREGGSYSCLAVLEGHRGAVKCLAAAVANTKGGGGGGEEACYVVYSGSLDCDIKVWQICVPSFVF